MTKRFTIGRRVPVDRQSSQLTLNGRPKFVCHEFTATLLSYESTEIPAKCLALSYGHCYQGFHFT